MKKGCFITALVGLTIIIGAISYVIKFKPAFISGVFRPMLADMINDDMQKHFNNLRNSPEKDSLTALVDQYVEFIKKDDRFDFDKDADFFDELRYSIKDSTIDSAEIERLRKLITKQMAIINERRKENSN